MSVTWSFRALAALAVLAGVARLAHADTERYAVVIGHNGGAADEQSLRYAESDAQRFADLLSEIGSVPNENQVVLRGKTADQVRRAMIATNERIRTGMRPGSDSVLYVYYSGHGDADAVHLGDTRLPLRELESLVRGSPAGIRILVIDSCRSGSITRVKGGSPAPPLVIATTSPLQGEGMIVLTASTLSEDAQESDQLGGSFFTHYLLSGLRGAADENGDRIITVAELFSYTHDQTVVASSRTLAGTQHPTFRYDLRGRADLALADLGDGSERGMLTLPRGAAWLVMRIAPVRSVIGEVAADARQRTLSLRPGTYAVRGRARDTLLEGTVIVVLGRDTLVEVSQLDRATYAPLARKGEGASRASGPFVGLTAQTLLFYSFAEAAPGFIAGWTFAGRHVTVSPRVSATWSPSWNTLPEYSRSSSRFMFPWGDREIITADVRAASPRQLGRAVIDLGIVVGAGRSRVSDGQTTERYEVAHFDLTAGISTLVWGTSYVGAEIAAQTYVSFGQASAEHLELLTTNLFFGVRL
jgi:hypothetical protein